MKRPNDDVSRPTKKVKTAPRQAKKTGELERVPFDGARFFEDHEARDAFEAMMNRKVDWPLSTRVWYLSLVPDECVMIDASMESEEPIWAIDADDDSFWWACTVLRQLTRLYAIERLASE